MPPVAGSSLAAATLPGVDRNAHRLLTSLSDLAPDLLARVPNALTLVRLGPAQLADRRGDLADLLLVDTRDRELGRGLDGEVDTRRRLDDDRVAESKNELQVLALGLHPVADANDLELLLVTLRDAGDHVRHQGARKPVQCLALRFVVRPDDLQRSVVAPLDADGLGQRVRQGALGSLHRDGRALDVDLDTAGHRDRKLANSRHDASSSRHQT